MLMSKALSRVTRSVGRRSMVLLSSSQKQHRLPILSNQFASFSREGSNQFVQTQVSLFHHSALSSSPFQRFGFSSASPEENEKEHGNVQENNGSSANAENEDLVSEETKETGVDSESQSGKRRRVTQRTAFSDSDSDSDSDSEDEERMSADKLAKLLGEKEELLKQMQDKVLRTYAEMENVAERTKREAENSKKFAIQHFAKHLLDVADNLGRASSVVRESFAKIDTSKGTAEVVPILKTLLEGVEMTEKQLAEVFKKYGLEKFDPTNEPFDPHRHNAVFQVPDASKPPGTVAHVLKAGYLLHDRVIRPAEVGVTQEVENDAEANKSETNNQ